MPVSLLTLCVFLNYPRLPYKTHRSTENERHLNMETLYDYGARAGFWRLHRVFTKRKMPVTVFAVGMALERNPVVCHALKEQKDWEVASHGYRWIDYQNIDEETEREHIARTITIHERVLGKRPVGFYQGKVSVLTVNPSEPHMIIVLKACLLFVVAHFSPLLLCSTAQSQYSQIDR